MKNYIKLWLGIIILYGLACLLITPYILYNSLGVEAGILMSFGFEMIGLIWFPIWFMFFAIAMFYTLKWFDPMIDKNCGEYSNYPKLTLLSIWNLGMIVVIINNLGFIF